MSQPVMELSPPPARHDGAATQAGRASPTPHWRHVTRGPIFAANPKRREWVDGVGWCVRVRVDPTRPPGSPEASGP